MNFNKALLTAGLTAAFAFSVFAADVNAVDADGTTALLRAAHSGDLVTVQSLLKAGAKVSAQNRYGASPLSEAVVSGSGDLIEALLKAGADPNALTTPEGETVLMTASRAGNVAAVKALLSHKADVNAKESFKGQTAVMWAAAEGHPEVVKLLIASGADVKVRSSDRDTTLPKLAAATPVAPINRGGMTALLFAARQGEIESVKALLDGGADINEGDVDSNNALTFAILNTHYDLAQFLIDRGADVNIANKDGRTALYMAVDMHSVDWSPRPARRENDKLNSLDIVNSLIAHGANVNARLRIGVPLKKFAQDNGDRTVSTGGTPFMRAAKGADLVVMKLLLAKGADPKLQNNDGISALMLAAGVGYQDGRTHGTEAEALEAVKMCFDLGLDVNGISDKGETAAHGASTRGGNQILRYLADKGANLDVRNKAGFTPLDIASGKGGFGGGLRDPKLDTMKVLTELISNKPVANGGGQ